MAKKKSVPQEEVCANCRYHVLDKEEDFGRCHRYPPIMVPEGDQYSFEYPAVNPDDWCGEHKFQLQS
jgi:hypothetical protein